MGLTSEIYLTKKHVTREEWQKIIETISNYNGYLRKWKLIISIKKNEIRFFTKTGCSLPPTITTNDSFLFKESKKIKKINRNYSSINFSKAGSNIVDLITYYEVKRKSNLRRIEIDFMKIVDNKILFKTTIYLKKDNIIKKILLITNPYILLDNNFEKNKRYYIKNVPKYLEINKILHLLKTDCANSILKVDTFPYIQGNLFLSQTEYDFNKHSIVVGSSGSGKSKFISLLINDINKMKNLKQNYKFVVIDPHASLEDDIGGIGKVIDFKSINDSIDLFINSSEDIVESTELLLDLLKSLLNDLYNSKLERILRHSIHLLLTDESFNFKNLRKVILDLEYRTDLIRKLKYNLPISVIEFFQSDFNDLKTKYYTEAISPIIAFIDEIEMIPVFNNEEKLINLKDTIKNNFLTLFSLDRTKLGERVTKTISGLIMQQLLTIVEKREIDEHIIFIIDEVPVVENKILTRYLSEARKYNLSLTLATQYFSQISDDLKNSIFANVSNFFVFRVSKLDANILVDNFNMKLAINDSKENKVKLLNELNSRELIVRCSSKGILLPAFKAKTMDFSPIPRKKEKIEIEKETIKEKTKKINFDINNNINLTDILIKNSTSRKGNII